MHCILTGLKAINAGVGADFENKVFMKYSIMGGFDHSNISDTMAKIAIKAFVPPPPPTIPSKERE